MKILVALLVLALLAVAAGAGFIYSGVYNIGADAPHWPSTFRLIETLRERSIARHSESVSAVPPVLTDGAAVKQGAAHYSEMCTGCHLAPGMADTELRQGMYPQPPKLAEHSHASPAEQFWIIKHGIKATGMPAWGRTHDDASIWNMVAFLQQLPTTTAKQYRALTEGAAHEHAPSETSHGADTHESPPRAVEPAHSHQH